MRAILTYRPLGRAVCVLRHARRPVATRHVLPAHSLDASRDHTPPEEPMRRRLATSALAVLTVAGAVLTGAAPSSAGIKQLDYVALGDSYSAASGVSRRTRAPAACLRSIRNYPHVIAGRVPRSTDVTCGAAQTKDFFESQYGGVAPQLDALSGRRAGHHDHRRQRQQRLHRRDRPAAWPGSPRRPGQPLQGPGTATRSSRHADTTYPDLVKALRAVRSGHRRRGGDHGLSLDPAEEGRLLRQDAGREGRRAVPAQPAAAYSTTRSVGQRGRPGRPT